jgi:hypothetical protein
VEIDYKNMVADIRILPQRPNSKNLNQSLLRC